MNKFVLLLNAEHGSDGWDWELALQGPTPGGWWPCRPCMSACLLKRLRYKLFPYCFTEPLGWQPFGSEPCCPMSRQAGILQWSHSSFQVPKLQAVSMTHQDT